MQAVARADAGIENTHSRVQMPLLPPEWRNRRRRDSGQVQWHWLRQAVVLAGRAPHHWARPRGKGTPRTPSRLRCRCQRRGHDRRRGRRLWRRRLPHRLHARGPAAGKMTEGAVALLARPRRGCGSHQARRPAQRLLRLHLRRIQGQSLPRPPGLSRLMWCLEAALCHHLPHLLHRQVENSLQRIDLPTQLGLFRHRHVLVPAVHPRGPSRLHGLQAKCVAGVRAGWCHVRLGV
mmetsp:Transcript_55186/g.171462  ORF Transcript_55186/g.171462 Transcript_55186/m.171462 type:complete len:234 (-) Transcript_55186:403-1104(-)